jgi:hypothetical protein
VPEFPDVGVADAWAILEGNNTMIVPCPLPLGYTVDVEMTVPEYVDVETTNGCDVKDGTRTTTVVI